MDDHDTLLAIQQLLDGVAWDDLDELLEEIAQLLVDAGYQVHTAGGNPREPTC